MTISLSPSVNGTVKRVHPQRRQKYLSLGFPLTIPVVIENLAARPSGSCNANLDEK